MLFLDTEATLLLIGILLLTTVMAGTLSSRFGLPALIGFLGLGMLAGVEGPGGIAFSNFSTAQSVGTASLIFILFSGGMDTSWQDVRRVAAPALSLATVGVLVSAGIVAAAAIGLLGLGVYQAALLGAIIASTDAAAVFAILRSTGLDLHGDVPALIEVESGSNDPMAIFLVGAVLMFITTEDASALALIPEFVVQMAMGTVVGLGVGFAMPLLLKRGGYRQGGLAFVISIAAALIAFGTAHLLSGNGFLASYLAGLVAGNRSYAAKRTISSFQDGMAWLAQVTMFLTLGLLVTPSELGPVIVPGLVTTGILLFVARPVSVFLCLAPFRQFGWRAKLFVSWGGLRGAVPIVLATFPMVAGVPGAFAIFNIVFFVVLLSSLLQGPTIKWAARVLHIADHDAREADRAIAQKLP
ncbi:MAG: potassium/proton antiporter [Sphingomonadales bacterium]|nr:potassium/proton antiporter [Sphingomonadales bacterium]NCQ20435.1 potassium/proton antiporter [Sphingomonadales bacterium]NCT03043.1 potassium/proton antiporter [Sphingomonadales bacterium]